MSEKLILDNKKITFIGGGNMARALIDGLLQCGLAAQSIRISDPSCDVRQGYIQKGAIAVDANDTPSVAQIVDDADIIVLAVKPQVMAAVLKDLPRLNAQLVISIAAGLSIEKISQMLSGYQNIVRVMPNLPATLGVGAAGLYSASAVSDLNKQLAQALISASSLAIWLEKEEDMHTVTAISGSSPAYFFYVLEAMIAKAEEMGLSYEAAKSLVVQSMLGAAKMAQAGDPKTLRQQVTSPNGTTQAAIESLQHNRVDDSIKSAMQACYKRSQELGL